MDPPGLKKVKQGARSGSGGRRGSWWGSSGRSTSGTGSALGGSSPTSTRLGTPSHAAVQALDIGQNSGLAYSQVPATGIMRKIFFPVPAGALPARKYFVSN